MAPGIYASLLAYASALSMHRFAERSAHYKCWHTEGEQITAKPSIQFGILVTTLKGDDLTARVTARHEFCRVLSHGEVSNMRLSSSFPSALSLILFQFPDVVKFGVEEFCKWKWFSSRPYVSETFVIRAWKRTVLFSNERTALSGIAFDNLHILRLCY